jgi:hypothetical protein
MFEERDRRQRRGVFCAIGRLFNTLSVANAALYSAVGCVGHSATDHQKAGMPEMHCSRTVVHPRMECVLCPIPVTSWLTRRSLRSSGRVRTPVESAAVVVVCECMSN